MSQLPIAVIIGSTRPGRFADKPAQWIMDLGASHAGLRLELVDLRDYPMPFFEETVSPSAAAPKNEVAIRWAKTLSRFDGFILITPEYNHGTSAVLKNALDYAYHEYTRKPAAFVGYGGVGAARAIQTLRLTVATLGMAPMAKAVHIGAAEVSGVREGKSLADFAHLARSAQAMFDDLAWWGQALKAARDKN